MNEFRRKEIKFRIFVLHIENDVPIDSIKFLLQNNESQPVPKNEKKKKNKNQFSNKWFKYISILLLYIGHKETKNIVDHIQCMCYKYNLQ